MAGTETIILKTYKKEHPEKRHLVAGIETNEGTQWEHDTPYRHGYSYEQLVNVPPIEDLLFEVPTEFGDRLTSFFGTYIASRNTQIYNCHRFALSMIGSELADQAGTLEDADDLRRVIEEGEVVIGGLSLGQLGVVGCLEPTGAYPFHSLIGFDSQTRTTECIQVAGIGGSLTVSSVADSVSRYYSEGLPTGSLYTPRAHSLG